MTQAQAAGWDPLIDWAATELRAPLRITHGVIPVPQDPAVLLKLQAEIASLDAFALTALHDLVTLPGSLILGLAVLRGRLDAETAWKLARIDEEFQADRWGRDDEADQAAQGRGEQVLVRRAGVCAVRAGEPDAVAAEDGDATTLAGGCGLSSRSRCHDLSVW